MSSTAATSASKRPTAGLENGKQQSAKKSRIDDAAAGPHSNNKSQDDGFVISKLMPSKFTHVHLRLLKVLYSQISRESDDGKVKEEQWKHMEQFLHNRESVMTMAAKVKITDAIRKETTSFEELLENAPAVAHTLMNIRPTALPSRWSPHHSSLPLSSSSSKTYSSSASKFSSARFFSGAAKFGFSSSPGSGRFSAMKQHQQHQQMQQNQPIDVDANPFGILSTFLIHKHQMSATRFQTSCSGPVSKIKGCRDQEK
jgi:hypothetical protein